MTRALAAAAVVLAGCAALAGRGGGGRGGGGEAPDALVTLYRDGAFVEETLAVEVAAGESTVMLPRPDGVAIGPLAVAGTGGVAVRGWATDGEPRLAIQIAAARAGEARLVMRYATTRLTWQASYTLIEDGAGGRLHGALALANGTGRRWERARLVLIDRRMPTGLPLLGEVEQRVVTVAGLHAIRPGAQRVDLGLRLGRGGGALALRSTLVYDPVGTRLDLPHQKPSYDERYGVERWPAFVEESVLVDLSQVADGPLPSGPVRAFTVGDGGALVWRGEGTLLPPAADTERYTTVAVGRSPDVTGQRRRTDFVLDLERGRLVEEVTVTLHNAGTRPADVLVREHLYRGQCWALAYHSTGFRVAKEGTQQIGLGVTVPAGGGATVMYRVVYEWDDRPCRRSKSKT